MSAKFAVGDDVMVRAAFPPGHIRAPYFIRGHGGRVIQILGAFANPEELAYNRDGKPDLALYRVQFRQTDLWPDYEGSPKDTTIVDIYENWLRPAEGEA
jgi:nitrile hydratase